MTRIDRVPLFAVGLVAIGLQMAAFAGGCSGQDVVIARDSLSGSASGPSSGGSTSGAPAVVGGDATTELPPSAPRPKCGPAPTLLMEGPLSADSGISSSPSAGVSAAMDLAVNATDLFVAINFDPGPAAIVRVPLGGGPAVQVAAVHDVENALILTANDLIFAESSLDSPDNGAIVRLPLSGGPPVVLASTNGSSDTLATDGQNVYFADQGGTKAVAVTGGSVRTLTARTGSLTLVGPNLIVADFSAGTIFEIPAAGGAPTDLIAMQAGSLGPVIPCGKTICWALNVAGGPPGTVSVAGEGTSSLWQLASIGKPTVITQDIGFSVWRLAFDGTNFFATIMGDASIGSVEKVAAASGSVTDLGFGSAIAIDDECLYTANISFGVYSIEKSYADAPLP